MEKALVNAIVESYLQGVSTRGIREIVAHLSIEHLFPASVSRMAKDLDNQVQAFLLRLIEQTIPYLFVDAPYYKIQDGTRYVTKVVLVVAGVREDGYREIPGRDSSRTSKNGDLPGFNWSSRRSYGHPEGG